MAPPPPPQPLAPPPQPESVEAPAEISFDDLETPIDEPEVMLEPDVEDNQANQEPRNFEVDLLDDDQFETSQPPTALAATEPSQKEINDSTLQRIRKTLEQTGDLKPSPAQSAPSETFMVPSSSLEEAQVEEVGDMDIDQIGSLDDDSLDLDPGHDDLDLSASLDDLDDE
jgi:hypothetical protein